MKESLLISVSVEEKIYKLITIETWLKICEEEMPPNMFYTIRLSTGEFVTTDCDDKGIFRHMNSEVTGVLLETSVLDIIQKRLPTKEDIEKEYPLDANGNSQYNFNQINYRIGARWLLDKLLKEAE